MADPRTTAAAIKGPIGSLGGGFMISREMKAANDQTDLNAREFYFRGRCGVLGEVDADVVTAAATFFPPAHVRASWEGGRHLPVEKAVDLYAEACRAWGRRRLTDVATCERLVELLEPVVARASVLGAPLFAGWRAVPRPADAQGRAAQLLHVMRELRGGLHGVAVLAEGLDPLAATIAAAHDGSPVGISAGEQMAAFLQWPAPYPPVTEEILARRLRVEELTNELMVPVLSGLTAAESDELIELLRLGQGH